tara:strand:- start:1576 stop:1758 length:183 start_codon:yes stop_codon:yes gene_type:complete
LLKIILDKWFKAVYNICMTFKKESKEKVKRERFWLIATHPLTFMLLALIIVYSCEALKSS